MLRCIIKQSFRSTTEPVEVLNLMNLKMETGVVINMCRREGEKGFGGTREKGERERREGGGEGEKNTKGGRERDTKRGKVSI